MSSCPLCGRDVRTVLFSVDSDTASRAFFQNDGDHRIREARAWIERTWAGKSCDFLFCEHCSFSFADPFVAASPAFYAALYDSGEHYPEWKWEFQRTIEALRKLVVDEGLRNFTLIDIGAGDGSFAARILEGIDECKTVLCTEHSDYGKAEIEKLGILCVQGGPQNVDAGLYLHRFDVVCLFQVLEHLDHLQGVFHQISLLARERSHMFVAVPNAIQRSHFDKSGFYQDMPPVHIGRWTRQSIEAIAGRYGWRILEDAIQPEPFHNKVRRYGSQFYGTNSWVKALGWVRPRHLRRALRAGLIVLLLFAALPAVAGMRPKEMGLVYWVHLSRG